MDNVNVWLKNVLLVCLATIYVESIASEQHIKIVNNADNALGVDLTIPARTEALIRLKKINDLMPQKMLYQAIIDDSPENIRKAVLVGANVNQAIDCKSPLLIAVMHNLSKSVKTLLELGAIADDSMLEIALKPKDTHIAYMLASQLSSNPQSTYYGYTSLQCKLTLDIKAISLRSIKDDEAYNVENYIKCCLVTINLIPDKSLVLNLFKTLLPCMRDEERIWDFRETYSSDIIIEYLIKNGLNPNKYHHYGLNGSVGEGNAWLSYNPFMRAIAIGNEKVVKVFISSKLVDIHHEEKIASEVGYRFITPLMLALSLKHIEVAELLVAYGAYL